MIRCHHVAVLLMGKTENTVLVNGYVSLYLCVCPEPRRVHVKYLLLYVIRCYVFELIVSTDDAPLCLPRIAAHHIEVFF